MFKDQYFELWCRVQGVQSGLTVCGSGIRVLSRGYWGLRVLVFHGNEDLGGTQVMGHASS